LRAGWGVGVGCPDLSGLVPWAAEQAVESFADELVNIGELVVDLAADGIIGEFAAGAVALQRTGADLEHLQYILVVEELIAVDDRFVFLCFGDVFA